MDTCLNLNRHRTQPHKYIYEKYDTQANSNPIQSKSRPNFLAHQFAFTAASAVRETVIFIFLLDTPIKRANPTLLLPDSCAIPITGTQHLNFLLLSLFSKAMSLCYIVHSFVCSENTP